MLTFRPQICFLSYSCPALAYVSTKIEVSAAFLFRENRGHGTDGRTDRQTDGATPNAVRYGGSHINAGQHMTCITYDSSKPCFRPL